MVQAYTEQQRAEAVAAIASGSDIAEVSKPTGIALATLVRRAGPRAQAPEAGWGPQTGAR